ncbi:MULTISPECIES: glycosyltransferase family 2 protein [unclassified Paenibacillus]|uniref:glycosyltransferase family 2 protein n=1 Tax=unclassified Paenibacillus TaxID=185978 RepID=UPI00363805D9
MKKINVILPVYNESEVIESFNNELQNVIKLLNSKYEFQVIYVLDKSRDGTIEILRDIAKQYTNVKVIALSRRFGHQMSLVAGMHQCDGEAVIMMDCDLEHPPIIIKELLEKFEEGFDIVQTKRIYNEKISFFKKTGSRLFYKLLSKLSSVPISSDSADFRLISKRVVTVFKKDITEQNQFLRGLFPWVGFNQTNITFISESRKKGKSKYNLKRLINFATMGIIAFSKIPLKFSVYIGLTISILSIFYGLYTILSFFISKNIPEGWTSVIATVSFLGGIQLIFMGIIGEYIGGIFDEVKNRPLYIIEEEFEGVKNE